MIHKLLYKTLNRLSSDLDKIYGEYLDDEALILEISFGFGLNTYVMLSHINEGSRLISIDLSYENIKIFSRFFVDKFYKGLLEFIVADAKNLPFREGSFNVVVSHTTVHHIDNVIKALNEMSRVLKNNGRMIIIDLVPSIFFSIDSVHRKENLLRSMMKIRRYIDMVMNVVDEKIGRIFYYVVAEKS
jgi:ubiquinone/menaquinone biosynthesis C-methylase UbiE